ncbi:malto-oligosyltrehalose trehalohydrolase [Deinococcus metallilatus]|uniref:Malto-oligosyltrehalose trehalohydrolase n=1 Tax=Deinococcus metallilatus TaxID=1211322 RepID=A0AAJ5F7K2_9DEIO|nr:malto-oligosyltrehalose trehalohydrolase [Deinococcus metallilatus]MBB5294875.1 maltooligosyltrehalose trehalohydrolase [Deinococcus metallilatus]QBY09411.1 malto-oligosyltrehalose trehalohydrolase [Deinococcus metallilatus]RXJ09416.1 malto-oligosyltrehalose trehalohydrolase [Deinococcus metallilatus]TLK28939.1 malto-oligosyltrehalose trehalohydrolase [Deinococcus metallilatus]GMA16802.1 malto-oligosyltrehalose trehalohydrolase [Deinococcus metallilatus]
MTTSPITGLTPDPTVPTESDALATRLGAHLLPDGSGTRFRVWTTTAQDVGVRVNGEVHPMQALGNGIFELVLPVHAGARYLFLLDGVPTPDPYARFLPNGVHGEAEVVDLHAYEWQNTAWRGLPLAECVFYELHVGTFTPEGTYRAALEKLPELKALGVTAIEFMPLGAFPGQRGWGYDGVALYAPYAPYGRPEDLMAFVDAAHGLGLGVFLDAVYNHFGPDGSYLSAYSPSYFTDRFSSAWGAGLDYAEPHMRRYITGNARMWLRDYHFDGLRLDATQAMQDDSPVHILRELASEVHRLGGTHLLLAEDYRNLPELVTEDHLDGMWVDDFHHEVRVTLTGDRDGYYGPYRGGAAALANVINRGWVFEGQIWPLEDVPRGKPADGLNAPSFVYFIQNHDQIGNRAVGDRVHHLERVTPAMFRGASTLLLTLPMTPLLFQGQEWATTSPFPFFSDHHGELGQLVSEGRKKEFGHFEGFSGENVLDPQAEATFELAKLDWAEREGGEHARTLALYRDLLHLRRDDPVLKDRERRNLHAGSAGNVLWVRHVTGGGERVLLWNVGQEAVDVDRASLPFSPPVQVLLHSEGREDRTLERGEAVLLGSGA